MNVFLHVLVQSFFLLYSFRGHYDYIDQFFIVNPTLLSWFKLHLITVTLYMYFYIQFTASSLRIFHQYSWWSIALWFPFVYYFCQIFYIFNDYFLILSVTKKAEIFLHVIANFSHMIFMYLKIFNYLYCYDYHDFLMNFLFLICYVSLYLRYICCLEVYFVWYWESNTSFLIVNCLFDVSFFIFYLSMYLSLYIHCVSTVDSI